MKLIPLLLCPALLLAGCSRKPSSEAAPAPASTPAVTFFHPDPATAGTISGRVRFTGPKPAHMPIDMSEDPACVSAHKGKSFDESLQTGPGNGVQNAFVYVKSGLEGKTFAVPPTPVTIDQRGCSFQPRVLGIQTGQQFEVINSDPVTHNIHPMAETNQAWNHSQGPGDPPIHRKFSKPEIMIPVKCNIHPWMHAFLGVLDHPFFAVTTDNGSFTIPNLPPGTYTIAVWQEKLGSREQQITVAPHSTNTLNFDLKGKS
ncbi:MAG TPA: carboxypeptidase regulatory-like domain-containing protein [Acidobacteriaceae bacterium]|jgi:plastocyanin|nr:carboxypeptidase regulatory-like domain-containing protein [Acidobacteriaceae bacterium]